MVPATYRKQASLRHHVTRSRESSGSQRRKGVGIGVRSSGPLIKSTDESGPLRTFFEEGISSSNFKALMPTTHHLSYEPSNQITIKAPSNQITIKAPSSLSNMLCWIHTKFYQISTIFSGVLQHYNFISKCLLDAIILCPICS